MDTTFITIHDLSDDANILYSSDSIVDILGHTPDEVVNRSVWQFFHPEELPFAKAQHSRGVKLDKAAVLSYCRLKNRQGDWIGCECCFSVVYDVMVCCTSIYRNGMQSQKRAVEAPIVRKLFASSPKDPRYHMLSHLSSKFDLGPEQQTHEPRAALFLNRFTRTLTVMYATSGIEQIIGISGEAMKGRSFYYCIAPNCLEDAVRCLESAKGNDSIAYMRFFFRDPRQDDPPEVTPSDSEDDIMTDVTGSDDESEGGVEIDGPSTSESTSSRNLSHGSNSMDNSEEPPSNARTNSGDSNNSSDTHQAMFGGRSAHHSSTSSIASSRSERGNDPIELEAVISCAQHPAMVQAGPSLQFQNAFMQSIRDVAVFAWALTGINGSLADYARGSPNGESQPPEGFPVWNPLPDPTQYGRHSAAPSGYVSGSSSSSNDPFGFGDPGLR
ncbi:hypothetical protein N0V83_010270 [Neocucurbitaria cava]|uniref:PAS domain-containing protein n=1 Tax=Neocucurbitaria cava TaxID=798079 RepID=A0A9W8XZI4_9PLEO|nr:hypothetical protein N0V83_010270 [Neocucurbitaria cava]